MKVEIGKTKSWGYHHMDQFKNEMHKKYVLQIICNLISGYKHFQMAVAELTTRQCSVKV